MDSVKKIVTQVDFLASKIHDRAVDLENELEDTKIVLDEANQTNVEITQRLENQDVEIQAAQNRND